MKNITRYIVWLISIAAGVLTTVGIIVLWFDTTLEHYGTVYAILTAISIMSLVLIWLDYIADTGILPD